MDVGEEEQRQVVVEQRLLEDVLNNRQGGALAADSLAQTAQDAHAVGAGPVVQDDTQEDYVAVKHLWECLCAYEWDQCCVLTFCCPAVRLSVVIALPKIF